MIRNLTPHVLNFVLPGETISIAPDPDGPARCAEVTIPDPAGSLDGIPLIQKVLGALSGLPDPAPGVALVVSLACAQRAWASGRSDVLAIGETIRDPQGKIIGAASLASRPGEGFAYQDEWGNRLVGEE